jgi:hypothetical protein
LEAVSWAAAARATSLPAHRPTRLPYRPTRLPVQYIMLLRNMRGVRTRLREAYEAFAGQFPLSEELWLMWADDELKAAEGAEGAAEVLALLQRAAKADYLVPAVWDRYLR